MNFLNLAHLMIIIKIDMKQKFIKNLRFVNTLILFYSFQIDKINKIK